MKKLLLILFACSLVSFTVAQDIPVTIKCDMGVQVVEGGFTPGTDMLVIRGDFQDEAGDPTGGDWSGTYFELTDANADTIYEITVNFPPSEADSSFKLKFVIAPDGWESSPDRPFTVTSPSVELPTYWYNNDSVYNVVPPVTNTLTFYADISTILGIGAGGAFDANQDSIQVEGLDWDGFGRDVTGNRRMVEDDFTPGLYTTTLTFTSGAGFGEGDSTKWKFKTYPDGRFSNNGYETGTDRWYYYQADGTVSDMPVIVPRIYPLFDTLENDINVTFNLDVSDPVNSHNGEHIDPAILEFVGMRGGADFLGQWSSGCWCPDDTTAGIMYTLTDMGNNQYSRTVNIPGGTQGGGIFEYKYCMMYPGADTVNGGSSPLDNEGSFGVNHSFVLVDGPDIVINNVYGDFSPTSVEKISEVNPTKFELSQNYPNPFNPSTKIQYTVPQSGLVTMKVYNLLGELISTLVNEEQTSGVYEVTFDASQFSSGIYFYSVTTGEFTATKKMMLLK